MPVKIKKPPFRKLRGYAFDPSLSLKVDTAFINNMIYRVPWESELLAGPIGEYVEIIDFDPTTKKFYSPVNLDDADLLAQDGIEPSEHNPQFHQQMLYAVIMTTIRNFEMALGRKVLWAARRLADSSKYEEYVPRLRVYPHAMRDANAYYSPQKKALLFGYFEATPADSTLQMPNSYVFTCLSHDIIAHEVTHAILDGMFPLYCEATNPDVHAFHEAFADIVALFQHFTFPDVLKHQIAKTRGDLAAQNLLGELAQEFGSAIGRYGSLRSAIGEIDPVTMEWKPIKPTGEEYGTVMEPHQRGSILVSAVFDAFLTIYQNRVKDLLRIATGGTGVLPQGELHPDLVNRLAEEAAKAARHVLTMCIRALDYCPPVDITFGDYLRAIITADTDVLSDDPRDYRLAFIEGFRRRGIYPQGLKTFSAASLDLGSPDPLLPNAVKPLGILVEFLKEYRTELTYITDRKQIYELSKKYISGGRAEKMTGSMETVQTSEKFIGLHSRIIAKLDNNREFEKLTGLMFSDDWSKFGIGTSMANMQKEGGPSFQIQNLRLVSRVGPHGNVVNQIVFSLVQRSGIRLPDGDEKPTPFQPAESKLADNEMYFYGGCTMIFDLDANELSYAVSKPLIDIGLLPQRDLDWQRIERQIAYQREEGPMHLNEYNQYFGHGLHNNCHEPFSLLHH